MYSSSRLWFITENVVLESMLFCGRGVKLFFYWIGFESLRRITGCRASLMINKLAICSVSPFFLIWMNEVPCRFPLHCYPCCSCCCEEFNDSKTEYQSCNFITKMSTEAKCHGLKRYAEKNFNITFLKNITKNANNIIIHYIPFETKTTKVYWNCNVVKHRLWRVYIAHVT